MSFDSNNCSCIWLIVILLLFCCCGNSGSRDCSCRDGDSCCSC